MPRVLTFWKDLDDGDKLKVRRITGAFVALLTVFTFLSCLSYLFTWQLDQSLSAGRIWDTSTKAANLAGKSGFKWADLLVREGFGLGSFAFVILLFAISVRSLFGKWRRPMFRTIVEALSGAMVISATLSFVSDFLGLGNAFGGGLGGGCGEALSELACNLFGKFLSGLILVALLLLWLVFVSKRFKRKVLSTLGGVRDGSGREEADDGSGPAGKPARWKEADRQADRRDSPADSASDGLSLADKIAIAQASAQASAKASAQAGASKSDDGPSRAAGLSVEGGSSRDTGARPLRTKEMKSPEVRTEVVRAPGLETKVTAGLPRIDVREELPDFVFPPLDLLEEHSKGRFEVSPDEIVRNIAQIRKTLSDYKIRIDDVKAIVGPTVTLYKIYKADGQKIADIKKLQDDIGMSLHARGVRVEPLTDSVGIEVPNDHPSIVPMRAVLNDDQFRQSDAELPVAIGYTIQQKVKVFDLTDAPHLLVAGATKQGKSVGLNVIVSSLLYAKHPSELKFVFVDPKMVEFSVYSRLLHHYLAVLPSNDEREEAENAIVKKAPLAAKVLKSLCVEMDQRFELLSKAFVPNIKQYNEKYRSRHLLPTEGHRFLPYIVTVIDEYADLTMSVGGGGDEKTLARSITTSIIRLAQKGRAAGIHVVLATQRPSVDVITGLIKTNFPMRIAFRVVSRVDSMTILGFPGAEKLIGRGDMLFYAGVETERVQCAYIDNEEIGALTGFIESQKGYKKSYNTPFYLPDVEEATEEGAGGMVDMKNLDERFEEAAKLVVTSQRGSTSDLQRRLGMGYAKAGRVMDQLEAAGVVGPQEGSKPRQVQVATLDELEEILAAFKNQQ